MQDSSEGIDVEDQAKADATTSSVVDEDEDESDGEDDLQLNNDEDEEHLDRVAQFEEAFEGAKETDTFGYVVQPYNAVDNLSWPDQSKKKKKQSSTMRTPKDLTAISWAAFCTGNRTDIQRDVMKIQALDMTNVLQRLQLASAMLRQEKKKLKAKLALAGITVADTNEDDDNKNEGREESL